MTKRILAILAILIFMLPALVRGAAITSTATGNWSAGGSWVGGTPPGDGDTATIDNGHIITVDVNTTVGDPNGAAAGITINGASSESYGTLRVADGVKLIIKGVNTTTEPAILNNQYGHFEPQAGSITIIKQFSDWGTCIVNKGILTATGTSGSHITFETDPNDLDWSNTVANEDENTAAARLGAYDIDDNVFIGCTIYRPISNAAGDGIGSLGDTSFTPDPNTSTPEGSMVTEVATYGAVDSTGEYYVDYANGVFYFYSEEAVDSSHHVYVDYKYLTFYGSGILSQQNTDYNSATFDYCDFNYLGSNDGETEHSSASVMFRYKRSPDLDTDRQMWAKNCTFQYCYRPLGVNDSYGDANQEIEISNNTLNYCPKVSSGNFGGLLCWGTVSHIQFDNNAINSYNLMISGLRSTANHGLIVEYNTGTCLTAGNLVETGNYCKAYDCYIRHNTIVGFGTLNDDCTIDDPGTSDGYNCWEDNVYSYMNRVCRLGSYMILRRNKFHHCYHHGIVSSASDGYIHDSQIYNNIIYSSNAGSDMGGGFCFGYNRTHWADEIEIINNTFDGGRRAFRFGDDEGGASTIAGLVVTRCKIINNNFSNSDEGIYRDDDSAAEYETTKLALSRMDYNLSYNNTSSNMVQATFMMGGIEYNTDPNRNVTGVYLFDPNYTLPYATECSLVLTVAGTPGTDASYTLAWGDGNSVETVSDQGTAEDGSETTLQDTDKDWDTNEFRAFCVEITDGTGSGQYAIVKSNNADTLTVIANDDDGKWDTAPDTDSVYIIFDPEVILTDPNGTRIHAGLHVPTLATSSQTDTGITIEYNGRTGDPGYTDAASFDFTLTSPSDGINRGTIVDAPSTDYLGENRISPYDIGAYESKVPSAKSGFFWLFHVLGL